MCWKTRSADGVVQLISLLAGPQAPRTRRTSRWESPGAEAGAGAGAGAEAETGSQAGVDRDRVPAHPEREGASTAAWQTDGTLVDLASSSLTKVCIV